VFVFGLPFPQEIVTPTTIRDFIRTLLGQRPRLHPVLGSRGSGDPQDIEVQKNALIAYRAKIVALIEMLEGGVRAPGNEPIIGSAGPDSLTRRCGFIASA
jgi:hypothetical protein